MFNIVIDLQSENKQKGITWLYHDHSIVKLHTFRFKCLKMHIHLYIKISVKNRKEHIWEWNTSNYQNVFQGGNGRYFNFSHKINFLWQ
jgi:ABC-type Mn2+/Zn2+ transport system ATPase subunit